MRRSRSRRPLADQPSVLGAGRSRIGGEASPDVLCHSSARGATRIGQLASCISASPVLPSSTRATAPQRRDPITSRSTWSQSSPSTSAGLPRKTSTSASAPVAPQRRPRPREATRPPARAVRPTSPAQARERLPIPLQESGHPPRRAPAARPAARAIDPASASAACDSGPPSYPTPIRASFGDRRSLRPRGATASAHCSGRAAAGSAGRSAHRPPARGGSSPPRAGRDARA